MPLFGVGRSKIAAENVRVIASAINHPAVHLLRKKLDCSGSDHSPPTTRRNGPGARSSRLRGKQSNDAIPAMVAAIRGNHNKSSNATRKSSRAKSVIERSGPVIRPPENSVSPSSTLSFQVMAIHRVERKASVSFVQTVASAFLSRDSSSFPQLRSGMLLLSDRLQSKF